ncbi:MAG: broad specificity phosphatase PhoE [Pseudomonadales bacterium]|jgi:broad specificity phosphatase PhoE
MSEIGRVLLVRHGQTFANINKVWHGHTDTALTKEGEGQAIMLGKYFHNYLPQVHAIYASPLQRAHNTAKQIALNSGAEIGLDARLMEFGVGDFEDMSFDELSDTHDFFAKMMADEHHRAPNGETRYEVGKRFVEAVEEKADQHQGENIVIVAHGISIGCGLAHWEHNDTAKWVDYRLGNTSVSEVNLATGSVIYFNKSEHI